MQDQFSDYVVYVDESGDHGLDRIDTQYPVFCLSFCVISKNTYMQSVVPAFQRFKFDYFGHDLVILHEHEIRKQTGSFSVLRANAKKREQFQSDLTKLMQGADFNIIASVIRKEKYARRAQVPDSPYQVSLLFCLERLAKYLSVKGVPAAAATHIIFECRGAREDADLELYFRRLMSGEESWGYGHANFTHYNFVPVFRHKQVNSTGLQLADLTARPIALSVLRPNQENRAYNAIKAKVTRKTFP